MVALVAAAIRTLVIVFIAIYLPVLAAEPIAAAHNLPAEAKRAVSADRIYLLYVSRLACPYCALLEKNVLFPMLRNDDYLAWVDLHELSWEGGKVVDFDRHSRTAIEIISRYGVIGTPTLLFLDVAGNELTDRIIGYHSEDFYWHYFDKAIRKARKKLLGE